MRIRQINLDDHGLPDRVTAELTRDEALYIATILGKQNDLQANEIMSGGAEVGTEIYDSLTGELFNRYWEDGHRQALAERATSEH